MGAAVSGPWGPRPYTLGEFIVNHALNPLATFINVHLLPPPAPSSTTNVSPNSPIRVEGLVANFTLDAGDPLIVLLGHWQRIDLNTLVPWQLMSHLMSANEAVTHEIQREDGLYGPFGLAYATPLNLLLRSAEESGLYPYLQGRRWFRSQGNRRYFSYPGGGEADFELRVNNSGRMPVFLVEIKRPDKAPTQYLHDIVDAIRGGGGFTLEYSEDEGRFWIVNREGYLEEDEFWLWTARTLAQVCAKSSFLPYGHPSKLY
ncbi:hypothetical protein IAT38_000313 [Cryptococcus sp. DSM 104549]